MSALTVAQMRAALGLGSEISDAAVVEAYVASLGFAVPAGAAQPALDPWAIAAAAMFRAPGSVAVLFSPKEGEPVETRAIRVQGDQPERFGGGSTVQTSHRFYLPAVTLAGNLAGVAAPRGGDELIVTDPRSGEPATFVLYGDPMLDAEATSWDCPANPA